METRHQTATAVIKEEIDSRHHQLQDLERDLIEKKSILKAAEILYRHNQFELAGKILDSLEV